MPTSTRINRSSPRMLLSNQPLAIAGGKTGALGFHQKGIGRRIALRRPLGEVIINFLPISAALCSAMIRRGATRFSSLKIISPAFCFVISTSPFPLFVCCYFQSGAYGDAGIRPMGGPVLSWGANRIPDRGCGTHCAGSSVAAPSRTGTDQIKIGSSACFLVCCRARPCRLGPQ